MSDEAVVEPELSKITPVTDLPTDVSESKVFVPSPIKFKLHDALLEVSKK